ncbi:MAG: right-handed parallel beta-helix repeat-containing protein [Promethearchaeota archaeon]
MNKKAAGIILVIIIVGIFATFYFLGGGTGIIIRSDSDFEDLNLPGNGTSDDPYLIEGRWISSNPVFGGSFCISIRNTAAYVVIRDCTLSATRTGGITVDFTDATNIIIENCDISNSRFGVWVFRCSNIGILNNEISNCGIGITMSDTDNYLVSGNTYSNCGTDESIDS